MTENKRFNFNLTFGEDEHKGLIFDNGKIMKTIDVVYLLNKQQEIIIEQSIQLDYLQAENHHMKDVLDKNTCLKSINMEMEDYLGRLEEQLDYIQNSISNAIKHQKTKIGEKALREVVEDYNEWMLGHKEVKK